MDLHAKHGIPRELYGVKIKIVELRQNPDVNCRHPGCFRIRPVGSLYCPPHDPGRS